jgi:hypothetical protein
VRCSTHGSQGFRASACVRACEMCREPSRGTATSLEKGACLVIKEIVKL